MADVFISYRRQERPRVEALAQKLRAIGFDVWFDTRLASGDSFDEEIAKQIQGARTVLVAWTPGAAESDWVRSEAALARSAGKLTACYLEPTELLPPFNLIHTEDLADWSGEDDHRGWVRLLAELCVRSGRADLAEWGRLVQADDRAALSRWADTAPGGPLRASARFVLSQQASFGASAAPGAGRARKKRGGVFVLVGAAALVVAAVVYLMANWGPPSPSTSSPDQARATAKAWSESVAVVFNRDGATVRLRADSLSNCISVNHDVEVDGQTIPFESMSSLEVLRADDHTSPNPKAQVRIQLLGGAERSGAVGAGCDLFGYNDTGRYTTYWDRIRRIQFER